MKIYKCNICGQLINTIEDKNVVPYCCGQPMEKLEAIHEENSLSDKHVPIFYCHKNKVYVEVGSVLHPMSHEHFIKWVLIVTNKGCHKIDLKPGDTPKVEFNLSDDEEIKEVYSFCNIHQLYKANLSDKCKTK